MRLESISINVNPAGVAVELRGDVPDRDLDGLHALLGQEVTITAKRPRRRWWRRIATTDEQEQR